MPHRPLRAVRGPTQLCGMRPLSGLLVLKLRRELLFVLDDDEA